MSSENMKPTLPQKPVRIGIIGCGNVLSAYRASIDQLRLTGQAEAVIACGRENQRAAAAAELGPTPFTTQERDVLTASE
jgi:predicted dehydrogenase